MEASNNVTSHVDCRALQVAEPIETKEVLHDNIINCAASEDAQDVKPEEPEGEQKLSPVVTKKTKSKKKKNKQKNPKLSKKHIHPPHVHVALAKQLNWFLPIMTSPSFDAPHPVLDGLSSPESQKLIADAGIGIWESMEGFAFQTLPFLAHEEMVHLACCVELLPVPRNGVTNLFFLLVRLYQQMYNRLGSFPDIDGAEKTQWYASVRQEVYNGLLLYRNKKGVEAFRQSAFGFAALRVPVMMKIIDACNEGRRNYVRLNEPAKPTDIEIISRTAVSDSSSAVHFVKPRHGGVQEGLSLFTELEKSPDQVKDEPGRDHDCVMTRSGSMDVESKPCMGQLDQTMDEELTSGMEHLDGFKAEVGDDYSDDSDDSDDGDVKYIKHEDDDEVMVDLDRYDEVAIKSEGGADGVNDPGDNKVAGYDDGGEGPVNAESDNVLEGIPSLHEAGQVSWFFLRKLQSTVDAYIFRFDNIEKQVKSVEWMEVFGTAKIIKSDADSDADSSPRS